MKRSASLPIPVNGMLRRIGSDIRDARLRRRIPVALLAERTGLSRGTLRKVEQGDPTVSLGAFVSVLFSLGLVDRLKDIADSSHDQVGRQLEEEHLPKRIHSPRSQR